MEPQATYYQKNRDRLKAQSLAHYHNSGKCQRLRRAYGITLEDAIKIWRYQGGECAICRKEIEKPGEGRDIHTDHCHETGKVRGILCRDCNVGLGYFRENLDSLKRAIRYLELHN